MKKYVSVFILTSLLLTGCGSAAGTADSGSAPAANVSSEEKSESQASEEASEESSEAPEQAELEYFDLNGVDIPILAGLERSDLAKSRSMKVWIGGSESDPVYLAMEPVWDDGAINNTEGRALDELPDVAWVTMLNEVKLFYEASSFVSKKTVDSSSETQFLDYPTLCEKGTILTHDDEKLNFVAYYTYMDTADGHEKTVPSFWMAFTPSDSKEALDLMNEAADAPLTLAKMHGTE